MAIRDHQITLTGFADEGASEKTVDQQFATMAAIGLDYFSIRFIDVGNGIENVLDLTKQETQVIRERMRDYGLRVSSIGSPIGKIKIADVDDGTSNRYVPFDEYLAHDVQRACQAANHFDSKLIRGFSFYHPQSETAQHYLSQVVDQIGQIVAACDAHGLTFGLELEANLIGNTGAALAEIHRQINHPALVLIFDGGNLVTQGFGTTEILDQFELMLDGLGWMHVKDYLAPATGIQTPAGYVDEEALDQFVPADQGSSGYTQVFAKLKDRLPEIRTRLRLRGIDEFFVDLEPHLRGGGQFGGFSGADGMGIALRAVTRLLDSVGLSYALRDFARLRSSVQQG